MSNQERIQELKKMETNVIVQLKHVKAIVNDFLTPEKTREATFADTQYLRENLLQNIRNDFLTPEKTREAAFADAQYLRENLLQNIRTELAELTGNPAPVPIECPTCTEKMDASLGACDSCGYEA